MRSSIMSLVVLAAMMPLPPDVGGQAVPDTITTQVATLRVDVVAEGLTTPVALAFLPDGRAILAERTLGTYSLLDRATGARTPIRGLPSVLTDLDGGVLDVVAHHDFADNGWLYLAYSEAAEGGSTTVLDRARLEEGHFADRTRLFTAQPSAPDHSHFAGRIALADGYVFLSIGDRQPRPLPGRQEAQSLASHAGTIIRLHQDGLVPADNPFVGRAGARPEIWSYGHRNPQGLAFNPWTGSLWSNEHGPQGGDEVNVVLPARNYGWPTITYGEEYGGGPVGDGRPRHPGMTQPIWVYRPSIAPSALTFLTGNAVEAWRGSALIGALGLMHLNRLTLDGDRVIHEERVFEGQEWRIRLVEEGPDGIYVGTDSGRLVRLTGL